MDDMARSICTDSEGQIDNFGRVACLSWQRLENKV
jgi:hypothetical protein